MGLRLIYLMLAAVSGFILAASGLFALNAVDIQVDETVASVSINHNLDFSVYYLENDMFEDNPVPINLNFLMSFTDYILINDGLVVTVSEPVEVRYDFTAVKRLVVTSLDAPSIMGDAIVFEQSATLAQSSGQDHGSFVQIFGLADGGIEVSPREFISQYNHFVEYHLQQMIREDVMALGSRNFDAELHVDFIYDLQFPGINHRESSARSISIPLSSEVFSLAASGEAFSERTVTLPRSYVSNSYEAGEGQDLPITVYIAGILVGLAGLVWSIMMFAKSFDEKTVGKAEYEKEQIIKKYSDNIVVAHNPIDFSDKTAVVLKDFKEMLKLSMLFNRPIIYCKGLQSVDFVLVDDALAYVYNVGLDQPKTKKVVKSSADVAKMRSKGRVEAESKVPVSSPSPVIEAKKPEKPPETDNNKVVKFENPQNVQEDKAYTPKRVRSEGSRTAHLQRMKANKAGS